MAPFAVNDLREAFHPLTRSAARLLLEVEDIPTFMRSKVNGWHPTILPSAQTH